MKSHGRLGVLILFLALAIAAPNCADASSGDAAHRDLDAMGAPVGAMPVDAQIARALTRVSPIQIQHTIAALVGFHNRSTLSSMVKDLPPGTGVSAAADWIEAQFRQISAECGGCLEVKRDTFTQEAGTGPHARVTQPTTITDVYAILRGSDPTQAARMILVTGHYDSRDSSNFDTQGEAPGANDDASGVAVSLECARALSKMRFPATLVFVAVAGEEQGLYGSRHLAQMARQQNWDLEGVLNNDIVGGNRTPGDRFQDEHAVRVFSEGVPASDTPEEIRRAVMLGYDSDSPSRELAREITEVARTYTGAPAASAQPIASGLEPVLEFRLDRFLRGGDHYSFNQQGYAAVRFTEWREDFNHQHQNVRVENGVQYGDLLKFVDFDYVARVARLNAATMAVLADAPPEPVDVTFPPTKVFDNSINDTTIEWRAGAGAPAGTRYEIVWRATAAPNWQRAVMADKAGVKVTGQVLSGQTGLQGATYSVTLPISKDNVIFGVRAVDAHGHRSPAVVPWPSR
ncbi:MAG: M20/M25/M40 family metallo-hydrolase [Acidobacteriaceae bacterium]